jgi:hypothetical protein
MNRDERRRFERHPVGVPFSTPAGSFVTTALNALNAAEQWDAGDSDGAIRTLMGEPAASALLANPPAPRDLHAFVIDAGARAVAATRDYLDSRGLR